MLLLATMDRVIKARSIFQSSSRVIAEAVASMDTRFKIVLLNQAMKQQIRSQVTVAMIQAGMLNATIVVAGATRKLIARNFQKKRSMRARMIRVSLQLREKWSLLPWMLLIHHL